MGQKKKIGAPAVPHSLRNFRRVMRIPNMCLVLKLDNGKVVSIANKQTESCPHPVPYYNLDDFILHTAKSMIQGTLQSKLKRVFIKFKHGWH